MPSGVKKPLLSVQNLCVNFEVGRKSFFSSPMLLRAVTDVSFDLKSGETLGIVGESGCGKSTLGRAILNLLKSSSGKVILDGVDLGSLSETDLRKSRKDMQMIFQDPLASLNPRLTIKQIISEPLEIFFKELTSLEIEQRVLEMMDVVGLSRDYINRYPHEFSGGQCQRIGIARAMIVRPKLLICDEAVSALDVSIQAQIINLLMDLQKEFKTSIIFISHNLSIVRHISHRVLVLYLGRMMELASFQDLYTRTHHPYTRALISAVPTPDPKLAKAQKATLLSGDIPSPIHPPSGCAFRTRCPKAQDLCAKERPLFADVESDHFVACHFPD
jgi:oligopeptide transport system ATP-binding protein